MNINISFTEEDLCEDVNKILVYSDVDQLHVSNLIDPKRLNFFKEIMPEYSEVVVFEHNTPICPECETEMNSNGSRKAKPNMLKGVRKKQYICPNCGKTKVTSWDDFIPLNCNYSVDIAEKGLNYSCFGYLPYEAKSEIIELENEVEMKRQTVYYLESKYIDAYLKRHEEINMKLLEKQGIIPSGYYHYDEQFPHENGNAQVRLTLIDSITNLVINDMVFDKKEFDKELVEAFLDSSLEGLPKEAIITDGAPMYKDILEKICVKHQMCIFHIIKNHHDGSFKKIKGIKRRINTINNKITANKTTIESLQNQIRNGNLTKKKKDKKRSKIHDLDQENKKLRKERTNKKAELKELLLNNERIENIYNADDKKGAKRRLNTLYNKKEHLDNNSGKFIGRLEKKFDKTTTFYDDPLIPKTNNGVERYFGITLPRNLKRKFRTKKGLTHWLQLQKIKWTRRNVLNDKSIKLYL